MASTMNVHVLPVQAGVHWLTLPVDCVTPPSESFALLSALDQVDTSRVVWMGAVAYRLYCFQNGTETNKLRIPANLGTLSRIVDVRDEDTRYAGNDLLIQPYACRAANTLQQQCRLACPADCLNEGLLESRIVVDTRVLDRSPIGELSGNDLSQPVVVPESLTQDCRCDRLAASAAHRPPLPACDYRKA